MKDNILDNIPKNISIVDRAKYISKTVRDIGFDWENIDHVFEKVEEEFEEIREEINYENKKNVDKIKEEIGDLIFSLINLTDYLDFDIREALEVTNKKFIERFKYVENSLKNKNSDLSQATIEEMERLWNKAKNKS